MRKTAIYNSSSWTASDVAKAFIVGGLAPFALAACAHIVDDIDFSSDMNENSIELASVDDIAHDTNISENILPPAAVSFETLMRTDHRSLPHGNIEFDDDRDAPQTYAVTVRGDENSACQDTLIFAHQEDLVSAPASLSKIMTIYVASLAMRNPDVPLNLDTEITVPKIAIDESRGLAKFRSLDEGETYRMRDYLRAAGSRSDARSTVTIAIATGRALGWEGTDEAVLERFENVMRHVANELGMEDTGFVTSTGDQPNYGTAQDFTLLMNAMVADAPLTAEAAFGEARFELPRGMSSRTKHTSLFMRNNPSDALYSKTGFLREADQTETAMARAGEFTITYTVFGVDSKRKRAELGGRILSLSQNFDFESACQNLYVEPLRISEAEYLVEQQEAPMRLAQS